MSSSPRIRKLTEDIFPIIGRYLIGKRGVTQLELRRFLEELSRFLETQNINGRTVFRPYNYQLKYVLNKLVASKRINEDGGVLTLSPYGKAVLEGRV